MSETTPPTDRDALFQWVLDLLRGLLLERTTFVILALPDNRFVQALVDRDGNLWIETVSNEFLDGDACLDAEHEALLAHMGWHPPSEHTPNWHRTFVDAWPPPTAIATEFLTATLLAIHGLSNQKPTIKRGDANPVLLIATCDERCVA